MVCRSPVHAEYEAISGVQLVHEEEGNMIKIVMLPDKYGGMNP